VSTEVSPTETAEVEVEELWEPTELDLDSGCQPETPFRPSPTGTNIE